MCLFASEDLVCAFAIEVDKRQIVAYNSHTQTYSSGSIVFFSCHPTAMCYAVQGNRSGHLVFTVQWSRYKHKPLGHNAPIKIDANTKPIERRPVMKAIYPRPRAATS